MTTEPTMIDATLADDDAPEMTTCDNCNRDMTEDDFDANDGLCTECLAGTFTCAECGERTFKTDEHPLVKTMCEACGDQAVEDRRQGRLSKAADAARDLLEAIIDLDDLGLVRKAVAALKRLQPAGPGNPPGSEEPAAAPSAAG